MAQPSPHYTVFQQMRADLTTWGYKHLDEWFDDELANCEELLEYLQGELQGRQAEAIRHGLRADEGHADRVDKVRDTIAIVEKWIEEIHGAGSLDTTALPMQSGDAPEDEDGEQDMVVSDDDEAPEAEAPEDEGPEDEDGEQDMVVSGDDEAPEAEAPEDEAPEAETPEDEAPEDEAPEDEAPEAEAPQDEAPQDEAPQDEEGEQDMVVSDG